MTLPQHLLQYAAYNLWANKLMADWLLSEDQTLLDKEMKSSFTTINKTLSHIWVAEHVWMCRIENLTWGNLQSHHDGKNTQQICQDVIKTSQWYVDKIQHISDVDLDTTIQYKLMSGDSGTSPLLHILHHVMNHSTYHRGQLVTMGRALDFTNPPKTDYIHYCRMQIL